MDSKSTQEPVPIVPYINPDGWYAQCKCCWTEITPEDKNCPKCSQKQDWTWFFEK